MAQAPAEQAGCDDAEKEDDVAAVDALELGVARGEG
jgi:hypothetical protein